MAAIISLLVIVVVSLVIVRVGSTALMMTGLSWDTSSFQAYSAFFGVGFTTRESEMVVEHPVRRRIIRHLILAGNVGVTAALGSVIVAFMKSEGTRAELRTLGLIGAGAVLVLLLAMTPLTGRVLDWAIKLSLRRVGAVRPMDYELLLRVSHGYCISEYEVERESWLVGTMLKESLLGSRGVVVLGIARAPGGAEAEFIGAPTGSTRIQPGDVLTVYGREHDVPQILARAPGA